GLTSLVQRLVGHVTTGEHVAAWVDAPDAFDPASAVAAGVDLARLLWIRPPDLATACTAAEALLAMGGFPLVLLDAGARTTFARVPPGARRGRPAPRLYGERDARRAAALQVWMRLARAAASSQSALVVLRQAPRRRTAATDASGDVAATAGS